MSKLSFKSFCIEYYAKHAGITGAAAYALFDKNGLVKTLDGLIAGYYGISENDALAKFYSTKTAAAFADDDIGPLRMQRAQHRRRCGDGVRRDA